MISNGWSASEVVIVDLQVTSPTEVGIRYETG